MHDGLFKPLWIDFARRARGLGLDLANLYGFVVSLLISMKARVSSSSLRVIGEPRVWVSFETVRQTSDLRLGFHSFGT